MIGEDHSNIRDYLPQQISHLIKLPKTCFSGFINRYGERVLCCAVKLYVNYIICKFNM